MKKLYSEPNAKALKLLETIADDFSKRQEILETVTKMLNIYSTNIYQDLYVTDNTPQEE